VPASKEFGIELGILDSTEQRRRLHLSTAFRSVACTPLHCQLPLTALHRNEWVNLALDLHSFVQGAWNATFHCLDTLTILPSCKLRQVFTMRDAPIDTSGSDNFVEGFQGGIAQLPRTALFSAGVHSITQILDFARIRGIVEPVTARSHAQPNPSPKLSAHQSPRKSNSPNVPTQQTQQTQQVQPSQEISTRPSSKPIHTHYHKEQKRDPLQERRKKLDELEASLAEYVTPRPAVSPELPPRAMNSASFSVIPTSYVNVPPATQHDSVDLRYSSASQGSIDVEEDGYEHQDVVRPAAGIDVDDDDDDDGYVSEDVAESDFDDSGFDEQYEEPEAVTTATTPATPATASVANQIAMKH